jgi:hypothetical protein
MQLSKLRGTALALLLVACGDDSGGNDETTTDAAATETPKSDSGLDSGHAAGSDTGVAILKDSSVADTGTKPVTDSGTPAATDGGGAVADTGTPTTVADAATPDAGGNTTPDAGSTTPDAGPTTTEESFAALYSSIFRQTCATPTCHGSPTHTSGLRMDSTAAMHASLLKMVGADQSGSPGSPCSKMTTLPRVTPGDPSKSWLMVMIKPTPPCGMQMPPPADGPKLSDAQQKRISNWIAQGAKNN